MCYCVHGSYFLSLVYCVVVPFIYLFIYFFFNLFILFYFYFYFFALL